MLNVCLYGGSFNPIHMGHIGIAKEALSELPLDAFYFLPAYQSPFKKSKDLIDANDRLEMVQMAVQKFPKMGVCDLEIKSQKVCYTVDTIETLKEKNSNWGKVYFLIGSDSLKNFFSWKDAEKLLKLVQMVVASRPEHSSIKEDDRFIYLANDLFPISASEIRERLKAKKSITGLVPEEVEDFINRKQLYLKEQV